MASIERTAYPRFKATLTRQELTNLYTPTTEEVAFAQQQTPSPERQFLVLVLLKAFQRLGYAPKLAEIPVAIISHIRGSLHLSGEWAGEDTERRTLYRYHRAIREYLYVTVYGKAARHLAVSAVYEAAQTMDNPADLIPYIVRVSTPRGRGTGFLVSRSSLSPLCAIATAAHVVDDAEHWEQPIRIQHYDSGKSLLLHREERVIFLDHENDTAAIVFNGNNLPLPPDALNLSTEGKIKKVGVELGWLGFPAVSSQPLCFFSGRINAHLKGDWPYLVDGVAINGVSGGPAFTCTGTLVEVVGVVAAYLANRATGEALPGLSVVQDVHPFQQVAQHFRTMDEVCKKKQEDTVVEAKEARGPSAVEGPAPDDADGHSSDDGT